MAYVSQTSVQYDLLQDKVYLFSIQVLYFDFVLFVPMFWLLIGAVVGL